MAKDEMIWDLSQLVKNADPASIEENLKSMTAEAEKIHEKYHGKIKSLNASDLCEFLRMKDAFTLKFEGATKYCRLIYSADSTDDIAKRLNNAERRASMATGQALAFIDVELSRLLAESPEMIADSALTEYRHYLERTLRKAPHMLAEAQERLVIIKDKNGINAWEMLQSDWLSTLTFNIEIEGKEETLPYGKMFGFFQSPDRDLRKRAHQITFGDLGKDEIVWASALRSVCEDHLQMCELRKLPTPLAHSLILNDVDEQAIDALMKTIQRNVRLYQKYLGLKARLMGLKKLANYDLMAPLPNSPKMDYSWKQARKEVVGAYVGFDEQIGEWVDEMFERRHIDAEVRKGKTSGAFCSDWLAGKSAYVLQSFNGRLGDVYTQAHELGHAVHAYLGARVQKPSNYEIGSCIAETGSVFGELLLTERLLSKAKTNTEKQSILGRILDEFGRSAFLVSARFFFEQSIYAAIKRGEFLDGETVAKMWLEARRKIYGDSVDWLDAMKWHWTPTPHYYMANYRFYNYPYVYAQLFVFALYRIYKEQGRAFVPKLKSLLAAGSSKSPKELAAELGFDVTTEAFWQKGMKQAEEFINMLEKTI